MSDGTSSEPGGPEPPKPTFPEQNADGIDLSLIRSNLNRSPIERVARMEGLLRDVKWIHANVKRIA